MEALTVRALACSALLVVTGLAAPALADDAVSRGMQQYDDAEFEEAVRTLTGALATSTLTHADVARALATLAAAEFALGHQRQMETRVETLAVVAPEYRFGPEVPPEIRDAFDAARAGSHTPQLRIDASGRGDTRFVSTLLAGTRTGLREIVLECVDRAGRRERVAGPAPSLDVSRDAQCEARAIWVGGAVIATASAAVATAPAAGAAIVAGPTAAGSEPPWLWIGIAAGAVAVIAVIVIIAVVASSSSGPQDYQVSPPVIVW